MSTAPTTTHHHVQSLREHYLAGATILVVAIVVAVGGSLVTDTESLWYRSLDKPAFMPPGWLFGVAWTLIYALTATAAWLAWLALAGEERTRVMAMFFANALLNLAWPLLFFGAQSLNVAAIEIVVLLASIVWLIAALRHRLPTAAWLLAPYLLWVSFASVLAWTLALTNG